MGITGKCEVDVLSGTVINAIYQSAQTSVLAIEIWNKAIEAAANVAEINSAEKIRKLKK